METNEENSSPNDEPSEDPQIEQEESEIVTEEANHNVEETSIDSDEFSDSDLNELSSLSDAEATDDDEFQLKPMKHSSTNSIDSYNLFDVTNVNLNNSKNLSVIEPVETTDPDQTCESSSKQSSFEKKKLSIGESLVNCEIDLCDKSTPEAEAAPEPTQKTSVFRSIGRFFWKGSNKDTTPNEETSTKLNPGSKITFLDGEQEQRWDFDVVTPTNTSAKKVLKVQDAPFETESEKYNDYLEEDSDEDEEDVVDETAIPAPLQTLKLELRDKNRIQCNEWKKQFKRCKQVSIKCEPVLEGELKFDAVIVPGNSFGFLDGEPEIRYSRKFGWNLQEDLQKIIFNEYDGELLVGQAVIVPLSSSEENEEIMKNSNEVRYVVYAPVMRVPLAVEETVNAYLALRAAIKAIKQHNMEHSEEESISSVLCPALCDGFGSMPPGRIAIQMKEAYEAFVLNRSEDLIKPTGLGAMATSHVNMTRNNGSWC